MNAPRSPVVLTSGTTATRCVSLGIFGFRFGATIRYQLVNQASGGSDVGKQPTYSLGCFKVLQRGFRELGGLCHPRMVFGCGDTLCPTTENAPAGSRGEFWGYYREERYVSLYMWIRGR
jgi:hypothetical protein